MKDEVLQQLDNLIESGRRLDDSFRSTVDSMGASFSDVPERDLRAYVTQAFAMIERVAGTASQFFQMLPDLKGEDIGKPGYSRPFTAGVVGCLMALRDAVDKGHLESLESRVRAHVHDDFLQQAKDLLDSQYHVAAMALIGGVLEDHLNKLCTKNGLSWNGHGSISKYNDACRQGNIFDQFRFTGVADRQSRALHIAFPIV